jgi:hypothetical protein
MRLLRGSLKLPFALSSRPCASITPKLVSTGAIAVPDAPTCTSVEGCNCPHGVS